jgi:tetratricopeptide (TPR) repeat protein
MHDLGHRELVCLYLDAHADVSDRSTVSMAVTAAGIGDALEVGDTVVDRVDLLDDLATMVEEGLLATEERPVSEGNAPRTVYGLTERGREYATELLERLEGESVRVTNGFTEEVPLSTVGRYLDDVPVPLVTALARVTDDGEVPIERHVGEGFVDRTDELATLGETIEASFAGGDRTAVVAGPAGVGTTALVEAAIDSVAADRDDVVAARGATPAGSADPYAPFHQAFEALPGAVNPADRLAAERSNSTPDDPETVRARRRALFDDIADGLRAAARETSVVVFIDNLQWADDATLELFVHLASTVTELVNPAAFVGAYRSPDVAAADDHPLAAALAELRRETSCTEVTLEPLGPVDTRTLLSGVVGDPEVPASFADAVYEETGGNPLFVTETATQLLESGQLDPTEGVYPEDPESVALPGEVTARIERRLEHLDEPGRELLRLAAVVGERVPWRVLSAATDVEPPQRREYADVLVASQILEPVDAGSVPGDAVASPDGGSDLKFVSAGLREAVVEQLPDGLRREYHLRVAAAFLAVHDDDRPARVAHHYERAGESGQAVEYYRRAGDRARGTYANEEAVEQYGRALSLGADTPDADDAALAETAARLAAVHVRTGAYDAAVATAESWLERAPEQSGERGRLLGVLADAESGRGAYDAARSAAERQRDLAVALGDRRLGADALDSLGEAAWRQGDYEAAAGFHRRSRAASSDVGDRRGVAASLKNLGVVASNRGDYERARAYFEWSLAIAREVDARRLATHCLNNLGVLAREQGDLRRAQELFERSLELKRELGDRPGVADTLGNLGLLADDRAVYGEAREHLEECLAIKREFGDRQGEAIALGNLGSIATAEGDYDAAREYYGESLAIKRDLGDRKGVCFTLVNLGIAEQNQGAYETAREHYERSLDIARDIDSAYGRATAHNNLASLARRRGDHDRAREHYERSRETYRGLDDEHGQATNRRGLGALERELGNHDLAEDHLTEAREAYEAVDADDGVAEARLELARLALARDDVEAASDHASEAQERFADLGLTHWVGRARLVRGRVATAVGATGEARDHWQAALTACRDVGAPQDALVALKHLVEDHREDGEDERAREYCRQARGGLADAPGPVAEEHREWVRQHATELGVD